MSARDELAAMFAPYLSGKLLEEAARQAEAVVLRKEADDVVKFCPDHGNHYTSYMDCHCAVADVLRQRAAKAAEAVS